MIDWITSNKHWIFSGIGVTIFLGIIFMLRKLFILAIKRASQSTPPPFDQKEYRTRPLPSQISEQVDSAPLMYHSNRSSEFLGICVQWRTTLQNIRNIDDNHLHLMLLDRGSYPWVSCQIKSDDYPDLKLCHKGTTIWIAGEITGFENNEFTLTNPKLKILLEDNGG